MKRPITRQAPKRILVIRLSAIGDVVMASPLIGALRRTWPGTEISWMVEDATRPVLQANAAIQELIVWPRGRWRQLIRDRRFLVLARESIAFLKTLRKNRFDVALDAQGLLKSGVWAYLSGAPLRIGIGSKEGSRYLMTRVIDRTEALDRISSQYLLLAESMGLDTRDFSMEFALTPEAEEYGARFVGSLPAPCAVLAPFTTRPQKHWIEERWTDLADRIRGDFGLSVVVLGGPGDRQASENILKEGRPGLVNLTGTTSLQEAAAVIKNASLLIGVDTGLTHMGYAFRTPTIALFGATRPYLDTAGAPGRVLYHPRECSPCRRSPTCEGDFTCMRAITVEEVILTARDLLEAP